MDINPLQFFAISKIICSKEKWLRDYGIDIEGCMRLEDCERSISSGLEVKQKMEARKDYGAAIFLATSEPITLARIYAVIVMQTETESSSPPITAITTMIPPY